MLKYNIGNKWDNLNNIRREARRHFRNKKQKYLKELMSMQQTVRTRILETCMQE
jgi:hypothetical protein